MSLLLDALKKAAEKNQRNNDATKVDLPEQADETIIIDQTQAIDKTEIASNEQSATVEIEAEPVAENITEMELAEIISSQKVNEADSKQAELAPQEPNIADETVIADETIIDERIEALSTMEDLADIEDLTEIENLTTIEDSNPSLALALEDDDPSLKLALSDEEILLTDDDVTEFLGSNELNARLEDVSLMGIDESELKLVDETITRSVNLVEPPPEYTQSSDDTTTGLGFTSATAHSNQTTNLNNLTNDATLSIQDATSTLTYASDNYDRTLVKLDEDVSKVFTGMKADGSGVAMTPDFAKKVFIQKSTSLRKRNYKAYIFISFVLLVSISVLALFEMQSQISDIDNSLMSLKRNPVPSELRFKRKEADKESTSILDGRVDMEALALLKSLKDGSTQATVQSDGKNISQQKPADLQNNAKQPPEASAPQNQLGEEPTVVKTIAHEKGQIGSDKALIEVAQKKAPVIKKPAIKKQVIKIETKTAVSEESIWLKDAYDAFEKGNLNVAEINYSRVLAKDATNRDALLGQAAIFSGQNKNNLAIDNYQALLLQNPKDALAMTSLITASTLSPIESESRLKLLQRESPNASYLQFALGNVVGAQNRWHEAQQYYYSAFQSEPENPDYAYNLAVSLEQINKPEVAIHYYAQAIKNAQIMPATFNVAMIQQRIEVLSQ